MGWPGPVTYRQYEAWNLYFEEEWYVPSPTDGYLMKLLAEVRAFAASFGKDKTTVRPNDFVHKRETPESQQGMTLEQATMYSKAKYGAIAALLKDKPHLAERPRRGDQSDLRD